MSVDPRDDLAKALANYRDAIDAVVTWSRTLPDEHRATLIAICRGARTPVCFCGCHVSVAMEEGGDRER